MDEHQRFVALTILDRGSCVLDAEEPHLPRSIDRFRHKESRDDGLITM